MVVATHGRGLWEAPLITNDVKTITSGTTVWNSPKTVTNNIHVAPGATLKIDNTTINIGKNVKITIAQGAKVEVVNSTLTNNCGYTWKGIEVWGNSAVTQSSSTQGSLIMTNSTIEHAEEAIAVSKNGGTAYNGGIVQATKTKFLNNKRSISYMKYDYSNLGYFKGCTFKTDGNYRHSLPLLTHFSMWSVKGIKILGCTFETTNNWAYSGRVSGISAIDAGFTVDYYNTGLQSQLSVFKGLNRAINTSRSSGSNTFTVKNATFYENVFGIITLGHNNFTIRSNTFKVGKTNISGAPATHEGISIMSGTGFLVTENFIQPTFTTTSPTTIGIRAKDTGTENNEIL